MQFIRDLPIRRKLMLITTLISGVGLIVACAGFATYDYFTFRRLMVKELITAADVIGANSTAAISFGDRDAAKEALSSLRADPTVMVADIANPNHETFTSFARPGAVESSRQDQTSGDSFVFRSDSLVVSRPIWFSGKSIGTIRIQTDLSRLNQRIHSYAAALVVVLAAGLTASLIVVSRLQVLISLPILNLTQTAREIAEKKNYSSRAVKTSNDELGTLIDCFNEMLKQIELRDGQLTLHKDHLEDLVAGRTAELERVHKELVETSRLAGMAEVATGVLHNVGNVLNSVNVSSALIANALRKFRVASVAKIAALLAEHEQDLAAFLTTDSRGKMLPGFLSQLAGHLAAEQVAVLKELDHLQNNIEHIKEIVNTQQAYASSAGFIEPLDLRELLEAALRMNTASLNRHEIVVAREFEDLPPVPADKHKVLQILVNLITNARQAMKDCPEKRLTLGIQAMPEGSVRISVRDTGCGIAPENMTRVFAHGFTTKTDGHGFGLHSSALAAKEMKGSLTVHSDGPGHGAIFTLELPLAASHLRAA